MRSLGFQVTERPFEFSALPGRYAAQIIGGVTVVGCVGVSFLFAPWFGELTAALVLVLAYWLGSPNATREPWLRERGVNLEATRGEPRVWLVAHIDSKSQPIPSGVRTVGVILVALALIGQFVTTWPADVYVAYVGIAGGLLLMAASVGANSAGAADNASGVAAVLEAAAQSPAGEPLGILITDAEELALAGAAAWVQDRDKAIAVNCDTVDDDGRMTIFRYGSKSEQVQVAAHRAAREADPGARSMRPLPGVLTDSNAFRAAGWQTVTLARGTVRTLNRIHTRRDSLDNLRGGGIPDAARALARIVEELT